MIRMPFGRYRGRPIIDVPMDYLAWLAGNVELREPLRTAVLTRLGIYRLLAERDQLMAECRHVRRHLEALKDEAMALGALVVYANACQGQYGQHPKLHGFKG